MLCKKKNDSHKFFKKNVFFFLFLFFVIGCNYQNFCFLYFDSQHGVRLCINKNDEIVAIDCLHIDNESILSKRWVGSFILEGSLCAIFGRNWNTITNLVDDKDACLFDRVAYPRGNGRFNNNLMFCIRVAYKRIIPEKITLHIQFDSPVSQYVFDHNCEVLKNNSSFWLVSDEDISFDLLELSNLPKEAIQFSFVFNALVYENDSNSSSTEPLIVSQTCSCSSTIEEGFDQIEQKTYYWRSGPIKDLEYIS